MLNHEEVNKDKWLYKDLTKQVIGCCYKVHNELGSGHKESVYQEALSKQLDEEAIEHKKEVQLKVKYKKHSVGIYRADFVVENKVILEIKAVKFMPKQFEVQLVYYLKTTGYSLGLLVNFGAKKVLVRRRVWTSS